MIRLTLSGVLLSLLMIVPVQASESNRVHRHGITICAIIVSEMTEGKVSLTEAREIALAIANAGNKHFGRITCGEMWLYMALVYIESGFRHDVVNHLNCWGMFQVHAPSWARKFGVRYKDLLDKEINADIGVQVFKYYLALYKNLVPTLSAYNSDHPNAARGFARAVLGTRRKIQKRYAELYKAFDAQPAVASLQLQNTELASVVHPPSLD